MGKKDTKGGKPKTDGDIVNLVIDAYNKGYNVKDIAAYVKEEKDVSISKATVYRIVNDYKAENAPIDEEGFTDSDTPIQKPVVPPSKVFIGNKMNEEYQTEVVKKVKSPITDRIYTDYMETLEDADLLKALRYRYSYFARKNSMSFRQFVETACEFEKQYLEKEIELAGSRKLTEPDAKQILEMAVIGKVLKRL